MYHILKTSSDVIYRTNLFLNQDQLLTEQRFLSLFFLEEKKSKKILCYCTILYYINIFRTSFEHNTVPYLPGCCNLHVYSIIVLGNIMQDVSQQPYNIFTIYSRDEVE